MEGYIDPYYRQPVGGKPYFQRGAIAWFPASFLMDSFYRLKPNHYNPAKNAPDYYTATEYTPADVHSLKNGVFHHAPIHDQQLGLNEEFVVQRMKLRKGIVFSTALDTPNLPERDLKRVPSHWYHDCFVLLPVYSLEDETKNPKFPARFIEHVKAYAYPQLFHLPADYGGGMRQSVVRFDRMQVVHKQYLRADNLWLAEDALIVLEEWLRFYLFGELDENKGLVALYRKDVLSKLAVP